MAFKIKNSYLPIRYTEGYTEQRFSSAYNENKYILD